MTQAERVAYDGWTAYVNDGQAFVKTVESDPEATDPDRGGSVEVFMLDFMLELIGIRVTDRRCLHSDRVTGSTFPDEIYGFLRESL